MFIKSIKLGKNKRLWAIMLGAVTVATILITTTISIVLNDTKGINLNPFEKIDEMKPYQMSKVSSYYAKFEVNVLSNKNKNTYIMEEWCDNLDKELGNERYKSNTTNKTGDIISYIVDNGNVVVKSNREKLVYNIEEFNISQSNLLSLSTFLSLLKSANSNECQVVKSETEDIENASISRVVFDKNQDLDTDNCKICKSIIPLLKVGVQVSKLELILDKKTNKPVQYIVYNKENLGYIDIIYQALEVNLKFDNNIFAIND